MNRFFAAVLQPRILLLLGVSLGAILLGQSSRFATFVIGIVLINVLWTAGLNLLYGYTGLIPLVFAGIAGISAYGTTALVMRAQWSFWVAMPCAALIATIVGVLLGLPSLRLKGFYFTLSSLVIQTVLTLAFVFFASLTNGDTGISQIPLPDTLFGSGAPMGEFSRGIMLALFAWAGVAGVWVIVHSDLGKRLVAIREDEVLAGSIGIDVVRYKLLAFFISSLYAAVGGSLYASYVGFISPRNFDLLSSLNIWLMVAFGGRATILGPIIGAVILTPIPFLLREPYDTLKDVIYGSLIIVVVVLLPSGLYGELKSRLYLWLKGTSAQRSVIGRILRMVFP